MLKSLKGLSMDIDLLFLFSMQPTQKNHNLVLPSQQRLHELCFLQKLGCGQARLFSLVNKQVSAALPILLSLSN